MNMYCRKVKNTSFLLLWKHVILFFVLEPHFSAKIGNEMSAELRSRQLIFINCPAYLVLEKKPLSIVQLVIMIWEISPSGQNTKSSLLPMMHESFINKFPHMRIVASAFLLSCLLLMILLAEINCVESIFSKQMQPESVALLLHKIKVFC